jgi:hypothetical protein
VLRKVRAAREQRAQLREVVLAKDEQQLDGPHRVADELHEHVHDRHLRRAPVVAAEQRHELLELVEDQKRRRLGRQRTDLLGETLGREHDVRRTVRTVSEARRQQLGVLRVGDRDALDRELLARSRLHADAVGPETLADRLGYQPGVDERALARARVAVEHHGAVDRDGAQQASYVLRPGEQDPLVGEPERLHAPERLARESATGRALDHRAHCGISRPVTRR